MKSSFELDIDDQAAALSALDAASTPEGLDAIVHGTYDRIILTGMGSSHYAAMPSWRRLIDADKTAWCVDAGRLLDNPRLITADSLLIATSQSGASGEVAALLDSFGEKTRPAAILGVTNDPSSRLGAGADYTYPIHSGSEATVSTKSYLNTLAALNDLTSRILGVRPDDVGATAHLVANLIVPGAIDVLAQTYVDAPDPRLAFIGYQDHAATALYAGLITKEAAKVAAEGYVGGEFRHGPLELAGPGLIAVFFGGADAGENESLRRLAAEVADSGAAVMVLGPAQIPGTVEVPVPNIHATGQLSHGAVLAQHLAVALAKARGITPGDFAFGNKITTAL
ncbi:MAG: SIS domain-containing protein [Mycobacterium sp.]